MGALQSEAQLRPEQVMLLRLFKRGGLVLLLLAWLDRPVGETEVAAVLEVDRITARSYLRSLLAMGLISRTRREQGYRLTPGGQGILFSQMVRFSPSQPSSAAASGLTLLVNSNSEAEKETPNEGENLTIQDTLTHQGQENLAAFRAQGIGVNDRVKRAPAAWSTYRPSSSRSRPTSCAGKGVSRPACCCWWWKTTTRCPQRRSIQTMRPGGSAMSPVALRSLSNTKPAIQPAGPGE